MEKRAKKILYLIGKMIAVLFLIFFLAPMILLPLAGEGLLNPAGSFRALREFHHYLENNGNDDYHVAYPRENIKDQTFYAEIKNGDGEAVFCLNYDPDTKTVSEEPLPAYKE